jgi:hypothetical protein
MIKIKVNIKNGQQKITTPPSQPAQNNDVNILTISQLKEASNQITKIVPYDELSDDEIPPAKILIKPKITIKSKIKIVAKKKDQDDFDDDYDDYYEDMESDDDDELTSTEPIVALKQQPSTPKTIVKINVKQKTEKPVEYKSLILSQKPIKTSLHEPIILPPQLDLETFYDDGQEYYINWITGYIFHPDTNNASECPSEPIGKLIDTLWDSEDFKEDKYPLIKRKIEWFLSYELDVDPID